MRTRFRLPSGSLVLTFALMLGGATAIPRAHQAAAPVTLQQRLGAPADSRLVMIHADDGGVTHSVNQAIERAFADGSITSASIIVPAPWFPELAAFAKAHPEYDFGLHLALTAEWTTIADPARVRGGLRWSGVAPHDRIASLLDPDGFLWPSSQNVASHVVPAEASVEMHAQIERARHFGVPFTHFDTHMNALTSTPALTQLYQDLGREYHIPIWTRTVRDVSLDETFVYPGAPTGGLERAAERYHAFVANARADEVTVVIIHPALDTEELRAAIGVSNRFGALWRAIDFAAFTSPAMHAFLKQQGVTLVNWKQVKTLFGPD